MFDQMQATALLTNGDTSTYGLGLGTGRYRGALTVSHGGADAGYRTWLGRFPEHGVSITVLCNASTANPGALAMEVADVVLGSALATASAPDGAPAANNASGDFARYAGTFAHPTTGAPFYVTMREGRLVVGRVNGPVLQPIGDGRFRIGGQPVELTFQSSGDVLQSFHGSPPRQPVTLRRQAEPPASGAALRTFAGTYYSEELGATYEVTASDSALTLKTRMGVPFTVRPAYGDVFDGRYLVRFNRRNGRIDGFTMTSGRVRNVIFVRTTGSTR
jgi:hypothetical protein